MRDRTRIAIWLLQVLVAISAVSQLRFDVLAKRSTTVRTETILSGIDLYNTQPEEVMERSA